MNVIKYNQYSQEKVNFIISQYNKGVNTVDIANSLGTYNTTIRRILIRNNIPLRSNGWDQSFVRTNPFIHLDSETYYWLGMLASDGCLTKGNIDMHLKEEDVYHLEKYIQFLGGKATLLKQWNKKYSIFEYYVRFRNKEIYTTLNSLGITERKSMTLKVNFKLNWDFIRGVFDGDGCISLANHDKSGVFSIVSGSLDFINQISDFFTEQNINCNVNPISRKDKTANTLYIISTSRKEELTKLYGKLYSNKDLFLIRKEDKFNKIVKMFEINNKIKRGNKLGFYEIYIK